jgi:hypothetical protein
MSEPIIDVAELRRLAEAYAGVPRSFREFVDAGWDYHAAIHDPQAVLALLDRLEAAEAERDNLRRLLGLLWQRMNAPREGDVPPNAGLYIGYAPQLSAAEFREIKAALEGKG